MFTVNICYIHLSKPQVVVPSSSLEGREAKTQVQQGRLLVAMISHHICGIATRQGGFPESWGLGCVPWDRGLGVNLMSSCIHVLDDPESLWGNMAWETQEEKTHTPPVSQGERRKNWTHTGWKPGRAKSTLESQSCLSSQGPRPEIHTPSISTWINSGLAKY